MDLDAMDPAELEQDLGKYLSCFDDALPTDDVRIFIVDLMNAATKIQASFRGHMARKQAEKSKTDGEITKEMEKLQSKVHQT